MTGASVPPPLVFITRGDPAHAMTHAYAAPVDRLLSLGGLEEVGAPWEDYGALGITDEHVPSLIRMATDPELNEADSESLEVWAPLHAWRALGELRAAAAVEPLTHLLATQLRDEWVQDDLPHALGMIGGPAIGPARDLLADTGAKPAARMGAMGVLAAVARAHPHLRGDAIGILAAQLGLWRDQDADLNAFLVLALADLRATEAAPLIEAAFAGGAVMEFWCGDWEDIQVRLGLLSERITPRPSRPPVYDPSPRASTGASRSRAKSKNRRKEQRTARKRNRRK